MKPAAEKIAVYIVDSQRLFREVATLGLSRYQDIEVTGGCDLSKDVQILIEVFSPKVVLLSVDDHFQRGLDLGRQITTGCPVVDVVALSSNTNDAQLFQAIKSGLVAYANKEVSAEELGGIIRIAAEGEPLLRESVLLRPWVVEGDPNKQVTHIPEMSEQKNENHLPSFLQKLDASDRMHVLVLAMRRSYEWSSRHTSLYYYLNGPATLTLEVVQ
jgi:DNA-binding NarL/FixJ family response regulator